MLGENLSAADISTLREENDHGSVMLDGRMTGVEFHLGSDTPGGSVEGIGGSSTTETQSQTDYDNDHDDDIRPSTTTSTSGPVSQPPEEISGTGPIDDLVDELEGNSLDTVLGPVGSGTGAGGPSTDDDDEEGTSATGSTDAATIGILGGWLLTGGRVISAAALGTIGALLSLLTLSGSSASSPELMNNKRYDN